MGIKQLLPYEKQNNQKEISSNSVSKVIKEKLKYFNSHGR